MKKAMKRSKPNVKPVPEILKGITFKGPNVRDMLDDALELGSHGIEPFHPRLNNPGVPSDGSQQGL